MLTNIIKSYSTISIALVLAMTACGNKKNSTDNIPNPIDSIQTSFKDVSDMVLNAKGNNYRPLKHGDPLNLIIKVDNNLYPNIDSVVIKLGRSQNLIDTLVNIDASDAETLPQIIINTQNLIKLGSTPYEVSVFSGNHRQKLFLPLTITAKSAAPVKRVKILGSSSHNPQYYTQGLLLDNNVMYESTGEYGKSKLVAYNPKTLAIKQEIQLPSHFFGEGLTLLDGKLYQLTWQEQKCFVYDKSDFKKLQEFNYSGEGWGLTTDGERLYMTDGSSHITIRDPQTFEILDYIQVYNGSDKVEYLNEMEWIDGKIWANVYTTNYIIIIDPQSGEIEKIIDCAELLTKLGNAGRCDVLNGIALDSKTDSIYLTGKLWDKTFTIHSSDYTDYKFQK